MPTRRFSTMSIRPKPYAPTIGAEPIDDSSQRHRLAVERDRHALLEADDDLASARVGASATLR